MAKNFYGALGLTGGTDGMLDDLDGANLTDGDGAFVITASNSYVYILDDDSGAGESSPDVIAPDDNPGTKRWILVAMNDQDVSVAAAPVFDGGEFTSPVQGVTPLAGPDLVNKEYADKLIGTFKTFFLSDAASGIGALDFGYPHETGGVESTIVTAGLGNADDQLVNGWVTEAGEPNTTTIHDGVIQLHIHAKKGASNQKVTQLYFVLSWVDADGTSNKTTMVTSEVSPELTDTQVIYNIHGALGADVEIAADARLILDVYANVGAGSQDSVITLYMEGTADSYWNTKVDGGIWQTHSDKLDDLATTSATGAELTELTDGSETTLHEHLAYVDRGDPAAADWVIGALTADGTYRDLDCSGVVPAGAIGIDFYVFIMDDVVSRQLTLRKKGNTNEFNTLVVLNQAAGVYGFGNGTVPCNAGRVVEYKLTNAVITDVGIVITGWHF